MVGGDMEAVALFGIIRSNKNGKGNKKIFYKMKEPLFIIVDLFCGAGGLSRGLSEAGFEIVAAADSWEPSLRSYRANFERITHDLGFHAEHSVPDAVQELLRAFRGGLFTSMNDDVYYRVKYLKKHPISEKFAVKQGTYS